MPCPSNLNFHQIISWRCPFGDTPPIDVGHEVIVTSNLRLRDRPNPDGTVIATMSANMRLRILSGPQTAGGYTWWEVEGIDNRALRGWSVQNWLQALPWSTLKIPPTPTATYTPTATPTKQGTPTPPVPRPGATPIQPTPTSTPTSYDLSSLPRLESGDIVQTTSRVSVRSSPSSSGEVAATLAAGVRLRISASEHDRSGNRWWQAQPLTAAQNAGWIPETHLRLVPPAEDEVTIVFIAGIMTHNSRKDPAVIDGFAAIRSAIEQDRHLSSLLGDEDIVYYSYSGQYGLLDGAEDADYRMPLYDTQDTLPETVLFVSQMEKFRKHLGDLIEAHAEDRIILIGHSMGGVIATYWAATSAQVRRDQVELIVTIDSPLQGTQWADLGVEINDLPPNSSVMRVVRKTGKQERIFTVRNTKDRLIGPEDSRLDDSWYDLAGDYCYLTLCVVPEGLSGWELLDVVVGGHGAVLQHPSVAQEIVRVIRYVLAVPAAVGSGVSESDDMAYLRNRD